MESLDCCLVSESSTTKPATSSTSDKASNCARTQCMSQPIRSARSEHQPFRLFLYNILEFSQYGIVGEMIAALVHQSEQRTTSSLSSSLPFKRTSPLPGHGRITHVVSKSCMLCFPIRERLFDSSKVQEEDTSWLFRPM